MDLIIGAEQLLDKVNSIEMFGITVYMYTIQEDNEILFVLCSPNPNIYSQLIVKFDANAEQRCVLTFPNIVSNTERELQHTINVIRTGCEVCSILEYEIYKMMECDLTTNPQFDILPI
jgi:hypothetical protein